jgi:hypothetical protein
MIPTQSLSERFVMRTRAADKDHLRYQLYATMARHHLVATKRAFSDLQLNLGSVHLSELSSRQDAVVEGLPLPFENLHHARERLHDHNFL